MDTAPFDLDVEGLGIKNVVADATRGWAEAEQHRVERAIVGAIRAGYDGVDVHRPAAFDMHTFGIQSIEPWCYPEPDGANGYRTTRYTWDYFDTDELLRIARSGVPPEVLLGRGGGSE